MRFNIKIALHGAWVTTVATSVGSYQTKKLKAEEVTSPPLVKKIENFANKSCIVVVGSTGKIFLVPINQMDVFILFSFRHR